MAPTGDSYRVLQIHPTRRCNLCCLHCYSASGPQERETLSIALLRGAVEDAAKEGYTVAGISGGEPLLYRPLPELLEHAHQCGMITTVTSNGMLLDERRLEWLQGRADLLAISLDGPKAAHNRMRGSERAFDTMHGRLAGVRRSGIPFGFIFTLTQHNLADLEWIARFAIEEGARLLQIHPLEEVGFAALRLPGSEPDATVATWAYLQAARIQAMVGSSLYVQVDLSHREFLRAHPERIFADDERAVLDGLPLADLVSPVVIEADGTVVPVQHGFARGYALGSLYEDGLIRLGARWRQEIYPRFRALCRQVYADITAPTPLPMVNWYSGLASGARAAVTAP